jgi:hypothetical protein
VDGVDDYFALVDYWLDHILAAATDAGLVANGAAGGAGR